MDMASRGEDQGTSQSQPVMTPKSAIGRPITMVEKVAAAMAAARAEARAAHNRALAARGFWPDHVWEPEPALIARAAIEAMREPTFAMVTSGMRPHRNLTPERGETLRETNVRNSYRAMIDAAFSA